MCQCLRDQYLRAKLIQAGLKEDELNITIDSITELSTTKGMKIKEYLKEYCGMIDGIIKNGLEIDGQSVKGMGLVMSGPYGCGKSFCSKAIVRHAIESGYSARYTTLRWLREEIKARMTDNTTAKIISFYKDGYDLLVLDEAGSSIGQHDSYPYEIFMEIMDSRYSSAKPTILITNYGVKEMEKALEGRAWSRLRGRYWWVDFNDLPDLRIKKKVQTPKGRECSKS